MRILNDASDWNVTLTGGGVVRVWANGYQTLDEHYDFGILVDTEGTPAEDALITNRTPSDANRVIVSVARFPVGSVVKIRSG